MSTFARYLVVWTVLVFIDSLVTSDDFLSRSWKNWTRLNLYCQINCFSKPYLSLNLQNTLPNLKVRDIGFLPIFMLVAYTFYFYFWPRWYHTCHFYQNRSAKYQRWLNDIVFSIKVRNKKKIKIFYRFGVFLFFSMRTSITAASDNTARLIETKLGNSTWRKTISDPRDIFDCQILKMYEISAKVLVFAIKCQNLVYTYFFYARPYSTETTITFSFLAKVDRDTLETYFRSIFVS